MKFFSIFILAVLLACTSPAEASSTLWKHLVNQAIDPRCGHFPGSVTGTEPWRNKLIPLCYESLETEDKLKPWINAAMELWYAGGLPTAYKVQKASYTKCATQRANRLKMYYNGNMTIAVRGDLLGDPAASIHDLGHA
ncbi:hypothetical protein BDV10DRAFT_183017 [Aspergillus recurvatus]